VAWQQQQQWESKAQFLHTNMKSSFQASAAWPQQKQKPGQRQTATRRKLGVAHWPAAEDPLTPATLGVHRLRGSTNQVAAEFYQRMQEDLHTAKQHLAAAQERQAHYANLKRQDAAFEIGDQVLLSTANLRLQTDGPASKFNVKWTGPFTITERIGKIAYRLSLPSTMRIHPAFHISLLKPYFTAEAAAEQRDSQLRPPPIINDDIFTVDQLMRKRTITINARQTTQYLVLWKGYPLSEATSVPSSNLLGADVRKLKQQLDRATPAADTAAERTPNSMDTTAPSPTPEQHTTPIEPPAPTRHSSSQRQQSTRYKDFA
jgi:hypothetical protein